MNNVVTLNVKADPAAQSLWQEVAGASESCRLAGRRHLRLDDSPAAKRGPT
jgi:hypothetical protein